MFHSSRITLPSFLNECAPIQANPNFEEFFGLNKNIRAIYYGSGESDESNDQNIISDTITKKLCNENRDCSDLRNLTFCIFNVINLSINANNPPPVPYIDISNFVYELNRLESIEYMLSNNVDINMYNKNTSPKINKYYIDILEENNTLPENISDILAELRDNPDDLANNINMLKTLIEQVNTINSLTTIGTMEFIDMMAKFGMNRTMCIYKNNKQSPKYDNIVDNASVTSSYMEFIQNIKKTFGPRFI